MIKDAKKTNQNIDLAIIDFIKKELGVENLKLNDSLLGFSEDKLSFLVDKINKKRRRFICAVFYFLFYPDHKLPLL